MTLWWDEPGLPVSDAQMALDRLSVVWLWSPRYVPLMEFPILGRLGVREAWRQADQLARLARRLERLPRWQWCLVADLYEEAQPWPPTIRRLLEFVQVAGLTEPGPTAVT